jgi:hypothetical protein
VLCAWLVAKRPKLGRGPQIHLITCGSPLHSLYEVFFPTEIGKHTFEHIAQNASWTNFWRDTDPIATPVGDDETTQNVQLRDPADGANGARTRGHKDYWIEPMLIAHVEKALNGPS